MRLFLSVIISLVTSVCAAPKLILPDETFPLLRRDLLPLDVDGIRELANHLAILGDGPSPKTAEELRARVKTLTLSQRLSPSELRVRAIFHALKNGPARPAPDQNEVEEARKSTLAHAKWLLELPAHSEGHHLGQLILDTLAPIAPTNPLLAQRDTEGEGDRWRGLIADLSDFEGEPEIVAVPVAPPVTPPPKPPPFWVFQTLSAFTTVPMFCKEIVQTAPVKPALIKTSLIISEQAEAPETIQFQPKTTFDAETLNKSLQAYFKSTGQPRPQGFELKIVTDQLQYDPSNQDNIVAPIAMMLDAARTGRTLRENTILFASLADDGTLGRPSRAWELILHLAQNIPPRGTRLIVGPGLSEEFTTLLVIQKPEFFFNYEVILATTFDEARKLFYDDGQPTPWLITAIRDYQEVREMARSQISVPRFLALNSVKTRLQKIWETSANHLSAKMLATQGIRRPDSLSRFMVAQEIDRRLQPISNFTYTPTVTTDRQVRDLYKETRESLQPLGKLLERSEQSILEGALDLIKPLNSIVRESGDAYATQTAMTALQKRVANFRTKLKQIYTVVPPE